MLGSTFLMAVSLVIALCYRQASTSKMEFKLMFISKPSRNKGSFPPPFPQVHYYRNKYIMQFCHLSQYNLLCNETNVNVFYIVL